MTQLIDDFALPLPLTQATVQTAREFASQQPNAEKSDQVRLNTLAVLVVHDYLQLMEIPSSLTASDSWNRVLRLCADVADLQVSGLGRLECRPVLPNQTFCPVPPETWTDRIGYVVVEVDETAESAHLLGFVPRASTEELPISQLRSPEDLLDHLAALRYPQPSPLANLSQWLQGAIDEGWQTLEELLNPAQLSPAIAFRNRLATQSPAKQIELDGITVALAVDARSQSDGSTDIAIQLHPPIDYFLPIGTRFAILNEASEVELETTATGTEDFLEWQIGGTPGDRFTVEVSLHQTHFTQDFVI
ncbi:DUF1822 family protein [Phormidium sp. CLA17]|uniref:DUF1822 family protein n=1 Tax=Leptolyngbya sp. Cla-17 TaxID=2803751 RepID=UPI0014912C51|nr:DUF1822 family protein [Leptolyngbya sp. Cla-17]MBM0740876.1 DUF1822 family protein [Leptolyngbya sp. Cla-17]